MKQTFLSMKKDFSKKFRKLCKTSLAGIFSVIVNIIVPAG